MIILHNASDIESVVTFMGLIVGEDADLVEFRTESKKIRKVGTVDGRSQTLQCLVPDGIRTVLSCAKKRIVNHQTRDCAYLVRVTGRGEGDLKSYGGTT